MSTVSVRVEVALVASTDPWTDITADVLTPMRWQYGITGRGPGDVVAGAGECLFALRNDAGNSVATQGAYSPLHANVRAGWTYSVPMRVVLTAGAAVVSSVSSVTRSSGTATVTTGSAHGLVTGNWVTMAGAVETDYNGTFQITKTGATTFTYTVQNSPTSPATGTITTTQGYVKFRGKVFSIDPDPGVSLTQRVAVVSYDAMHDLIHSDVVSLALQSSQDEGTILGAVLDALPANAQPPQRSIAAGIDTYPYAFDDVGGGIRAAGLIKNVVLSGLGLFYATGDGTATYKTRHGRALGASVYTFANTMRRDDGIRVPSSLETVYNRVRATTHPKSVDAAATTVICALSGTPPSVTPGEAKTIFLNYRDPTDTKQLIGATAVVDGVLATNGTDYECNTAADGSGSDITTSVAVTVTAFASSAKFVVVNNHASLTAYLVTSAGATHMRARGKGIYDDGPQTFESYTAMAYGDRGVAIDLPYQDNADVGQSAAAYINAQYNNPAAHVDSQTHLANDSDALMTQMLAREPGDVVTVTESLTGLSAVDAVIQRVEIELTLGASGPRLLCRHGLAPAAPFRVWLLGTVGNSELDTSAVLGF